jgi:hypothetical protein
MKGSPFASARLSSNGVVRPRIAGCVRPVAIASPCVPLSGRSRGGLVRLNAPGPAVTLLLGGMTRWQAPSTLAGVLRGAPDEGAASLNQETPRAGGATSLRIV